MAVQPVYGQPMASGAPAPPMSPAVGANRWSYQASFIQRRQAAFWLFAVLLAISGLFFVADQLQNLARFPTAWFLGWLLLALYVGPVLLAIYLLDLFEREPISILTAAFLWGAIVTFALALPINNAWFSVFVKAFGIESLSWGFAVVTPVTEEILKYLGLVLIYLTVRREIDDLMDGFVYGAVIGLGFATTENVFYFLTHGVEASGGVDQVGPVFTLFLQRALFSGLYMHTLWTALAGVGLAYYATRPDVPRARRLQVAAGTLLLAILAHAVWNSPPLQEIWRQFGALGPVLYGLIKGLPFLLFLALLVVFAQRREHAWFQTATSSEVRGDVLTRDEVTQLATIQGRWRARRRMALRKGPTGQRLLGRLQREQINLAMIRSRVGTEDHPDLTRQRELIRSLRREMDALPDVPRPVPAPASSVVMPGPAAAPSPAGSVPTHTAVGSAATGTPAARPAPAMTPTPEPVAAVGHPGSIPAGAAPVPMRPTPGQATMSGPVHSSVAPATAPITDTTSAAPAQASVAPATAPITDTTSAAPAQTAVAPPAPQATTAPPWSPTHVVPAGGLAAWARPDPSRPPIATLPERLRVRLVERAGDWARVDASNGWTGWLDGRRLVSIDGAPG